MPVLYLVCAWREWEGSRTRMLCHEKLALYREGRGGEWVVSANAVPGKPALLSCKVLGDHTGSYYERELCSFMIS